jgi:solute carrier family 35 (adenosine 3'-phospho 5'-phosphosulfate transporter), member B2
VSQLFIFLTIKQFGPVVFAIIMSTRILLSILASCFLYDHHIPALGESAPVVPPYPEASWQS